MVAQYSLKGIFEKSGCLFEEKDSRLPSGMVAIQKISGNVDVQVDNIVICCECGPAIALKVFAMFQRVTQISVRQKGKLRAVLKF